MNTGIEPGPKSWQQASLPIEPTHWPSTLFFNAWSFVKAGIHYFSQIGPSSEPQGASRFCIFSTEITGVYSLASSYVPAVGPNSVYYASVVSAVLTNSSL